MSKSSTRVVVAFAAIVTVTAALGAQSSPSTS
jgi:hypothetical protein